MVPPSWAHVYPQGQTDLLPLCSLHPHPGLSRPVFPSVPLRSCLAQPLSLASPWSASAFPPRALLTTRRTVNPCPRRSSGTRSACARVVSLSRQALVERGVAVCRVAHLCLYGDDSPPRDLRADFPTSKSSPPGSPFSARGGSRPWAVGAHPHSYARALLLQHCNGVDWRQKLDSQRGAVIATELKNNSYKLARWTCCALLAGSEYLKLG